jgi:RNA polymerase sigma factor (sigma-70 family)
MRAGQPSQVIEYARRAALQQPGGEPSDGHLLRRFASRREESAFESIVRRHGPMVLGVCRRVLGNHHDAEDAFQATFLVLSRKAGSIASGELLANWLYGVAHNTALKAKAAAARRRARERQVVQAPEPEVAGPDSGHELGPLLDQELSRLPEKYRLPILLCDLAGKTQKEAAGQLGWPQGTVAGRLARGRAMLAARLVRRGLSLPGAALAPLLSTPAAPACVPAPLLVSTAKAASLFAAGPAAAGAISAEAAALAEGGIKAMSMTRLEIAAALLLVALAGVGAGGLLRQTRASEPGNPAADAGATAGGPARGRFAGGREVEGNFDAAVQQFMRGLDDRVLTGVDGKKGTISLGWMGRSTLDDVPVAAGARVVLDGKERRLADLRVGMWIDHVDLVLAGGKPTATWISAATRKQNDPEELRLLAVDAGKKAITVKKLLGGNTMHLPLATNAKVVVRAVRDGKKLAGKVAELADLKPGMRVSLSLAAAQGGVVVKGIEVEDLSFTTQAKR